MAKNHSATEVRRLQKALNDFNSRYKLGYGKLIVDGDLGRATRKLIREAKFDLGYVQKRCTAEVGDELFWRLAHPRSTHKGAFVVDREATARGAKRRAKRRIQVARNSVKAVVTSGVTFYDGRPVAKWLVPYFNWARQNGWQGRVVSGWRDPNYSRSLCIRMCGRASCPGKCAGASSNHSGSTPYAGAADVSDYIRFGQLMARCPLNPKLTNHLPVDRVHYSVSGR